MMKLSWITFLLLDILVIFAMTSLGKRVKQKVCKEEFGTLNTCVNPICGKIKFEMQWSPQNLTRNQSYEISIKNLDIPVFDPPYDEGEINLTIWIEGIDEPLINQLIDMDCNDTLQFAKQLGIELPSEFKCPFSPEVHLNLPEFSLSLTSPEDDQMLFPTGSFRVRLDLLQKPTRDSLLCIDGWLVFSDVSSDYTPCDDDSSTGQQMNNINSILYSLFSAQEDTFSDDKDKE